MWLACKGALCWCEVHSGKSTTSGKVSEMNKTLLFMIGSTLLIGGVSVAAPTSTPSASPVIDVKLSVPEGSTLRDMVPRRILDISPETNMAVVAIGAPQDPSIPRAVVDVMVADLKTGKLSPISNVVGKGEQGRAVGVQLSHDRKRLLVNWIEREDAALYAIELPDGKPVKIAGGIVMALWAGDKIAVGRITPEGRLAKIIMADPATGKSNEVPVRGMLVAGLPDGTVLVGGNPKAPAAEVSIMEACGTGRLFHIGAHGKVLGDIAPVGILSSPLVVSDNGRFIAFQSKPVDASGGPGTKYGFAIMSVDGKSKQELTTRYFPIAVTNDGAAIVISNSPDASNMAPVSWVNKDGKTVKEVVKAVSATVIGRSLLYTTNNGNSAIKTASLPSQ